MRVELESSLPSPGSEIDPLLFLAMVNDLPAVVTQLFFLFADDTKIGMSSMQSEKIQAVLNTVDT